MILKNALVFLNESYQKMDLKIEDGRITDIQPELTGPSYDCTGKKIIPGLFDIHTHGCLSYDFSVSTIEEIHEMCKFYAKHGVTSVLATTMTNETGLYKDAMSKIATAIKNQETKNTKEAKIQGINMEGPFFGASKKGAHDEQYLHPVSQDFLDDFQQRCNGAIRLLDIDPTLDGALDFIKANANDYTISLAHTSCTFDQAKEAVKAGATHVTHLFNAMLPMNHREPGLIGAASEFKLNSEIICDGIHIHPAVIHLMFRAMPEQMILISDSINPTGLPDGFYTAGGLPIEVKDKKAFLRNGTLAGSTITLFDAVKKAIEFGVQEEEAILSATYRPAKSVRLEDKVGSIAVERSADLLIVSEDFTLDKVIINGEFID